MSLLVALCLILVGICLRMLPHPANFAPITAIALFGGTMLPRKHALWVPLAAMVVSDYFIGFHDLVILTWGCYLLTALAANKWLKNLKTGIVLTLSASVFFFTVTNFGVWASSGMYERTWSGLIQCYTLALPFFRNTLLSDLIYTGAFFGLFALVSKLSTRLLKPNTVHI